MDNHLQRAEVPDESKERASDQETRHGRRSEKANEDLSAHVCFLQQEAWHTLLSLERSFEGPVVSVQILVERDGVTWND